MTVEVIDAFVRIFNFCIVFCSLSYFVGFLFKAMEKEKVKRKSPKPLSEVQAQSGEVMCKVEIRRNARTGSNNWQTFQNHATRMNTHHSGDVNPPNKDKVAVRNTRIASRKGDKPIIHKQKDKEMGPKVIEQPSRVPNLTKIKTNPGKQTGAFNGNKGGTNKNSMNHLGETISQRTKDLSSKKRFQHSSTPPNHVVPGNSKGQKVVQKYPVDLLPTSALATNDYSFLQGSDVIGRGGTMPRFTEDMCVAIDCEMVGTGDGTESMLARVSLVDMSGECIYDTFVQPQTEVVDYRTSVSGVQEHHMRSGANFIVVRKVVASLIHNRILVGHALLNDLSALRLKFPQYYIRDTSKYVPFRVQIKCYGTPSLKRLAREILQCEIQDGEHSSIEDAAAAMCLYVKHREQWEKLLSNRKYKKNCG